jgi:predicted DNA-binding transcriptional regulator AlpA
MDAALTNDGDDGGSTVAHRSEPSPTAEPESILLTEAQAAQLLGFSPRTLQAWRVRGGGPTFVHVSARCVRYRREDLEAWITERLRISTSEYGSERE